MAELNRRVMGVEHLDVQKNYYLLAFKSNGVGGAIAVTYHCTQCVVPSSHVSFNFSAIFPIRSASSFILSGCTHDYHKSLGMDAVAEFKIRRKIWLDTLSNYSHHRATCTFLFALLDGSNIIINCHKNIDFTCMHNCRHDTHRHTGNAVRSTVNT